MMLKMSKTCLSVAAFAAATALPLQAQDSKLDEAFACYGRVNAVNEQFLKLEDMTLESLRLSPEMADQIKAVNTFMRDYVSELYLAESDDRDMLNERLRNAETTQGGRMIAMNAEYGSEQGVEMMINEISQCTAKLSDG